MIQENNASLFGSSDKDARVKDEVKNYVAMLGDGDDIDLTDDESSN